MQPASTGDTRRQNRPNDSLRLIRTGLSRSRQRGQLLLGQPQHPQRHHRGDRLLLVIQQPSGPTPPRRHQELGQRLPRRLHRLLGHRIRILTRIPRPPLPPRHRHNRRRRPTVGGHHHLIILEPRPIQRLPPVRPHLIRRPRDHPRHSSTSYLFYTFPAIDSAATPHPTGDARGALAAPAPP